MSGLKARLQAGDLLSGTWVKTPNPIVLEVLGFSALDLLVLDAEHAPFGREALDLCIMAARASGKHVLVRPPANEALHILNALDCGADGVIAPHVSSVADAQALVKACHYGPGGRGFAGSSRAAGYTTLGMSRHMGAAKSVSVVAQIEDREALDVIDGIAQVEGIDALFIGRADLTVSLGASNPDDPIVVEAVEAICAAGVRAGRTIGMFLGRPGDVPLWKEKGARLFVLGSDHEFLLQGASRLVATVQGQ
jgi:2-keto-3-deoxy-L-rhamnonate aldolase RhmA